MRLEDILTIAKARLICPDQTSQQGCILNREVRVGGGADLMSDVLHYELAQGLLITGLTNPQIIRTAEIADVRAVLVVRGKVPMPETCELAEQVDIPLLSTPLTMFEACGLLYEAGLPAACRLEALR